MINKKDSLEKIWNNFKGKFENSPEIKTIFEYRYVHSFIDTSKRILFTGINPSYNHEKHNPMPYDVHKAVEDYPRYYKKFQNIADYCGMENNWTYLDLFYFRATNQKTLDSFLKTEISLKFLCEQLVLTQEILEEIKPKLILVFNKRSHDFWGKNINKKTIPYSNVWMGYDFESIQINGIENNDDLKIIKGLIESDGRVAKDITKTNLKGTLVYFLDFFQYSKKEYKENIYQNIKKIIQSEEFGNNQ